jgi:alpha-L-fucosidase
MPTWLALLAVCAGPTTPPLPPITITDGPFAPTWESLKQYRCPEWFRDAKFGIWACWSPQCVPEQGDWYARNMYLQGSAQYNYHVATYGHPSKFGYKDLINLWRGEHWDPEADMKLYRDAGAQYFCFMVNHHCNFDAWDSTYQPWNSVNFGPHKDLCGIYAKLARQYGLRYGVTVHCARSWEWFEVSHQSDQTGPLAGVPYDGALTKADGRGTFWEGYDPADLYGPHGPARTPEAHRRYVLKWYARTKQLLDAYHPDLLYFDDGDLPLGEAGMNIAAHFYNANRAWHDGDLQAVLNIKGPPPGCRSAIVLDRERGLADAIEPEPWQTDTCIGDWHYRRGIRYKSADTVIAMLADIVSKNGNLLLNIPVRGDGSLDDDEIAFLKEMAAWMAVNREAIFGTRPFKLSGEGRARRGGGSFNEGTLKFGPGDARFTTKGDTLYAILLGWPADGQALLKSLPTAAGAVGEVRLLGHDSPLAFRQSAAGLTVTLPAAQPCAHAWVLKIPGGAALGPVAPSVAGPPPVVADAAGRYVCRAREAEIHGPSPQYEEGGGKDNIGYWGDAADFVSWPVKLARPGWYEVEVCYSCAAGAEGSAYGVEIGGRGLLGRSQSTGSWSTFRREVLGAIHIAQAGDLTLTVKPLADWKVIGLQSVTLTPRSGAVGP